MRTIGTTIEVNRGETFVLDRTVVKSDGSPFILSSDLINPYILITVSSNPYELKGRWYKNYWLNLKEYPTFDILKPIFISSLENEPDEFNAVYYTMDGFGNKEYYMWKDGYIPYKFTFKKLFLNMDTRDWIESNYLYQINLMSGDRTIDWLTGIFKGLYPDAIPPNDVITIKNQICRIRPDLIKGIDDAPLVNSYTKSVLLRPSKLIIRSNI